MRGIGLASALLVSAGMLAAIWLIGRAMGLPLSLLGALGLTIVLTIVLNLILGVVSRRRRPR